MTSRSDLLLLAVLVACLFGCNDLGAKHGCLSDSDCTDDRSCSSGLCVAPCDPMLCEGTACDPLGGCHAGIDGDLCIDREHCAETRRCGPNLQCQPGAAGDLCTVQDHCAAGHYCGVDGQCHLGATGDPCENGPQCLSGICGPLARCQEGSSGDPCESENDCNEALSCGADSTCLGCGGLPTPCASLTPSACESTMGCGLDKACAGTPPFCGFQDTDEDCSAIDGCAWDGTSCSGFPIVCADYSSEPTCMSQAGCAWVDICRGAAVECSELAGDACLAQPGCMLE